MKSMYFSGGARGYSGIGGPVARLEAVCIFHLPWPNCTSGLQSSGFTLTVGLVVFVGCTEPIDVDIIIILLNQSSLYLYMSLIYFCPNKLHA